MARLRAKRTPQTETIVFNRWAVIIGISKYQYYGDDLEFAHLDAEALYKQLQSPECGSFPEENMQLLTNERATTRNIQKALRGFLKKPGEEDLVIIYISGHGAPDYDRPKNRYFVTHDTEPDDVPGTGIHMSEIKQTIEDTLLAKRVIVMIDSCHSGASIGSSNRKGSASDEAKVLQRMLNQDILVSNPGIAWLASSSGEETSQEQNTYALDGSAGHGVFTHYILRGLRGEATEKKTGKITINQLFTYVKKSVEESTNQSQHPTFNMGDFSADMPIAHIGGVVASEHIEVANNLMYLGEQILETSPFLAAAKHLQKAILLSRAFRESPELNLQLAKAWAKAGKYDLAEKQLLGDHDTVEEQLMLIGLQVLQNKTEQALDQIKAFKSAFPDQPETRFLSFIEQNYKEKPTIHFLQVGSNKFANDIPPLSGCINDINLLEKAFKKLWKKSDDFELNIIQLKDEEATKENIHKTFTALKEEIQENDLFIFHFSGHSYQTKDSFLVPYDAKRQQPKSYISSTELNEWVTSLTSQEKYLILDTDYNEHFIDLALKENNYQVLLGTDLNSKATEIQLNIDGEYIPVGTFSATIYNLVLELAEQRTEGIDFEEVIQLKLSRSSTNQKPTIFGNAFNFLDWNPKLAHYLIEYLFAKQSKMTLSLIDIHQLNSFIYKIPFFDALAFLGKEYAKKNIPAKTIDCFEKALQLKPEAWEIKKELALIYPLLGKSDLAKNHLADYIQKVFPEGENSPHPIFQLQHKLEVTSSTEKNALLVSKQDKNEDVKLWRTILMKQFNFKAKNIVVLEGKKASREKILEAFSNLAEHAISNPAFFFYTGQGSVEELRGQQGQKNYIPTILANDSRSDNIFDISFQELQNRCLDSNHLTSLIDADFDERGSRYQEIDRQDRPTLRDIVFEFNSEEPTYKFHPRRLQVGNLTILPALISDDAYNSFTFFYYDQEKAGTSFSNLILTALKEKETDNLSVAELVTSITETSKSKNHWARNAPQAFGLTSAPFGSFIRTGQKEIKILRSYPIHQLVESLKKEPGDERIELGLALQHIGEHHLAERQFRIAITEDNKAAHYPLGKMLVEQENSDKDTWADAVTHLRAAVDLEPNNIPAKYYLGKAIWSLSDHENHKEAESILTQYMEAGAPIGYKEEVSTFLNARDPEKQKLAAIEKGKNEMDAGNYENSINAFEEAIALGDINSYYQLGKVHELMGNYAEAYATFQQAKEIGLKHAELHKELGMNAYKMLTNPDSIQENIDLFETYNKSIKSDTSSHDIDLEIIAFFQNLKDFLERERIYSKKLKFYLNGESEVINGVKEYLGMQADLEKHEFVLTDTPELANYFIEFQDEQIFITQPNDPSRPVVSPIKDYNESSVANLSLFMDHLSKWNYIKDLKSPSRSLKENFIDIEIHQVDKEEKILDILNNEISFEKEKEDGNTTSSTKIRTKIINKHAAPLFVSLAYFSGAFKFSIFSRMLDNGVQKLEPGESIWVLGGKQITLGWEDYISQYNWEEETFYFKLFFSPDEFDISVFEMREIALPGERVSMLTNNNDYNKEPFWKSENWQSRLIKVRQKNPYYQS